MGRGANESSATVAIRRGCDSSGREGGEVPANDWLDRARAGIASLGFESYEVGGSLRDEVLGKKTKDLDVCVVGTTLEQLLGRLDEEGKADRLDVAGKTIGARLYTPWAPKGGIELALARREVSTGPGHKDFAILAEPDVSLDEDLDRRDFTCNALARRINPDGTPGELVDKHGGVADIQAGKLRAVGPTTIAEDPLRVLRGLARIAKDGLTPDDDTRAAMIAEVDKLGPEGPLSAERIFEETQKMMGGRHVAKALRFATDAGIFQATFPELAPIVGFDQSSKYHTLTVDEHIFSVLDRACEWDAPEAVRWAALLHDSGKPDVAFRGKDGYLHFHANPDESGSRGHEDVGAEIAGNLLDRLKAPKDLQKKVQLLVAEHMYPDDGLVEQRGARKAAVKARFFVQRIGRDNVDDLLLLRRCDRAGKGSELTEGWDAEQSAFEELIAVQRNAPLTVKELDIDGHDLLAAGLKGRRIGEAQREMLQRVVADPTLNDRERLLGWAESMAK